MRKRMVLLLSLITIGSMVSFMPVYAEESNGNDIIIDEGIEGYTEDSDAVDDSIVKNDETGVPDKALYETLVSIVGGDERNLTKDKLADITTLNAQNRAISNLKGIEYCTNLNWLILSNNQISDISPLAGLVNVESLWLGNNNITNIDALADMVNLHALKLENNDLSDISVLANLVNLESLDVSGNKITELPRLISLTKLDPSKYGPFDYTWYVLFSENEIKMEDAKVNLPAQLMNNTEWVERQGFVIPPVSIYKQQLSDKIISVDSASLVENEYTAESWNQYIEAVNYARSILEKSDATDEEYKNALDALENAQNGLKKIEIVTPDQKEDTINSDSKDNTKNDDKNVVAKDNISTAKAPKTGDNNNIIILTVLMLGSLMLIGAVGARKRI